MLFVLVFILQHQVELCLANFDTPIISTAAPGQLWKGVPPEVVVVHVSFFCTQFPQTVDFGRLGGEREMAGNGVHHVALIRTEGCFATFMTRIVRS